MSSDLCFFFWIMTQQFISFWLSPSVGPVCSHSSTLLLGQTALYLHPARSFYKYVLLYEQHLHAFWKKNHFGLIDFLVSFLSLISGLQEARDVVYFILLDQSWSNILIPRFFLEVCMLGAPLRLMDVKSELCNNIFFPCVDVNRCTQIRPCCCW